mgnify:CR=1 FL=1
MKLKTHLFCIAAMVCGLLSSLRAQEPVAAGTFAGGVSAGLTATQISGDNLAGFHKVGATAGVFANCVLSDQPKFGLKIQMEMNFVMKGSHSYTPSSQTPDPMSKYVLNLGYIEVPVLFRFRFARITIRNSSDFELEAGPAFGVNIYSRERDAYGQIVGRPAFKRWELSLMGGLNYRFRDHHAVTLRYSNSILPVRKPNWAINQTIKMQFNSVLYLIYSYQF